MTDQRCNVTVDVIWKFYRHRDIRCHQRAGHDGEHSSIVARSRSVFWNSGEREVWA